MGHGFRVGDRVRIATKEENPSLKDRLAGREASVVQLGAEEKVHAVVDGVPPSSGAFGAYAFTAVNLTLIDAPAEPTPEEVKTLFGIKEEDDLKAEALKLMSQAEANLLRLDAAVHRANAVKVSDEDVVAGRAKWDSVADAESEVHLARAACQELHADYIERWGLKAYKEEV